MKSTLGTAVNYKDYRPDLKESVMIAATAAALSAVFSYLFYDSLIPAAVLCIPALLFGRRYAVKILSEKRKQRLKQQFLSAAVLLSDYVRSGHSVENAVRQSLKELSSLFGEKAEIVDEWKRICYGMSVSETVESLFHDFGLRSDISEIQDFSDVFMVVKRTGGQIREVLSKVIVTLEESFRVESRIETAIAAKKLEQRLMSVIPAGLLLYVKFTSEDLMAPMYVSLTGRIVMTVCLGVYVAAFFISEKIMDIRV